MSWRIDLLLLALFALLLFPNLGARTLWQDEAETALVSQQMVKTNTWLPYAMDDQGPISQDWNYQFFVSPLWRWHPWLQFYVAALSFKLLGASALTARIPFAIIGVVFFWYYLGFLKRRGPKNRAFFLIASLLVLTSAPLFLHLRQARYYALSILFTLMTVDGYLDIREGKRSFRYVIGSIALFHSFLSGALALQVSFWIHRTIRLLRSDLPVREGQTFKQFATAFALTLLFTLPWAWWLKIGGQNLNFNPELIKQHLWQHYLYIHKFIVPFFLAGALVFRRVRTSMRADPNALLFLLVIAVNLVLYTFNHPYFFRYLVPLIPLVAYLVALILTSLSFRFTLIAALLILHMSWRTFPGYLYELTHLYVGTNEQIISIIQKKELGPIQSIATNYDDFTFRFHTSLSVYGPQHLPTLHDCPDLVIIFPTWGNEATLETMADHCELSDHREIPYRKLADDPDPTNHVFLPPTTRDESAILRYTPARSTSVLYIPRSFDGDSDTW